MLTRCPISREMAKERIKDAMGVKNKERKRVDGINVGQRRHVNKTKQELGKLTCDIIDQSST